jgi:hypothetical protein
LKGRWSNGLEACRAQALNRAVVTNFYNLYDELCEEFHIEPSNIYNMDEKGILLGQGKKTWVIVDHHQRKAKHVEDGSRELITALECVGTDGTSIPPRLVVQGKRRDLEWG